MGDNKYRKFWAIRVLDRIEYIDNELKTIKVCAEDSKYDRRAFPYADGDFMRIGMKKLQERINDLCADMEHWFEELDKEKLENGEEETTE